MTDRHTASTINDAQLDRLYARLEKLGQTIRAFPDANDAANLAHARAQRDAFATRTRDAEATLERVRAARDRIAHSRHADAIYCLDSLDEALGITPPGPAATEATQTDCSRTTPDYPEQPAGPNGLPS